MGCTGGRGIGLIESGPEVVVVEVATGSLPSLLTALVDVDAMCGSHPDPILRALGWALVAGVDAVDELRESATGAISADLKDLLQWT
ncbi:hypothetical protein ACI2IX_20200 [Leifsonia aquatica]|uniref:hypothetical protein n=1 Tax=Leifsonia aquatica TaxID=144185 RepID=UPI00384B8A77